MAFVINTNVSSLTAQRNLLVSTKALGRTMERLSTGLRINRAGDDAAGLQISEKLESQIRGVGQAIQNAQEGMNLLAIAEGSLTQINEHVHRIRELIVQGANETNGQQQLEAITQEIMLRVGEINRVALGTEFNGFKLLAGDFTDPKTFNYFLHIGPNNTSTDIIDIGMLGEFVIGAATTDFALTLNGAWQADVQALPGQAPSHNDEALALLTNVDTALDRLGRRLAIVGAVQNRLESAVSNLTIMQENYTASQSSIRDADVAREAANLTRYQILQQASSSVLSQANQSPALVLTLLGFR